MNFERPESEENRSPEAAEAIARHEAWMEEQKAILGKNEHISRIFKYLYVGGGAVLGGYAGGMEGAAKGIAAGFALHGLIDQMKKWMSESEAKWKESHPDGEEDDEDGGETENNEN